MKIALIGAGRIGRLHARHLAADPATRELLIADALPKAAETAARDTGGRSVPTVDEALDLADAVVIAAATDAHAALVRAAVERGLPTFVEKPLALELDETEDLVELIEESRVPVQVGFQRRFDRAYREGRRLVEAGELGRIYLVRLIAHDAEPPPPAYIPTSGGMFRDSSIHDFDAFRYITGGEVESVFALGTVRVDEVFERHDDVDTVGALLRLADGTLGVLSATRHNPRGYDIRMELVGARDSVSMGVGPRTPSRSLEPDASPTEAAWESFLTRFEDAYRAELAAFVAMARGESDSPCTAGDAFEAMRIAVAATISHRESRVVKLAEIARSRTEVTHAPVS